MQAYLAKLKALRNRCDNLMAFYHASVPFEEVDNIFNQFILAKEKINKEKPELFEGYQLQDYKQLNMTLGGGTYEKFAVRAIKDDINYYIDILQEIEAPPIPNLKITNEGIYFSGQYFEALSKMSDLIKSAGKEVIIIDGYIDEKVLNLLSALEGRIQIMILTKQKSITAALKPLIEHFNKQYANCLKIKACEAFHDRFLIIDKSEFYHIGASMKDAGSRGFMFSRIEEPFIQRQLISEFEKEWIEKV